MTFDQLLSELRRKDIYLWVDGDRLRYKGPESAVTDSLLWEIKKRKREIIEYLRRTRADMQVVPAMISKANRNSSIPLSYAQESLWFLENLQSGNASNHLASVLRLEGPLDVVALTKAVETLVQRHEVLRSTFPTIDGRAQQMIQPSASVHVRQVEIKNSADSDDEIELQQLIRTEVQRPFDLSHGPLLRVTLFGRGRNEHVLLFTVHHIVFDGFSFGLLYRELEELYRSEVTQQPSKLARPAAQYADFVHWQQHRLQEHRRDAQLSFWRQQLGGELPVVELPLDWPRPAVQTYRGGRRRVVIDGELHSALKSLSRREGASTFMILLAVLQCLLHRYTGADDIVIGSPIATRDLPEFENVIGILLNVIVFRIDLSGDPTFSEVLERVRRTALDAYSNKDVPFEKLVEELRLRRDPSRNPIFQTMLQLSSAETLTLYNVTASPQAFDPGTAQFDLAVHLYEEDQRLVGYFEYNADLFDPSTIDRMVGHYQTLLQASASGPQERLSELTVLTEGERHQLLVKWNQTDIAYPHGVLLHQLFEAQVERTPDAVAVSYDKTQWTFRELNDAANRLARYLARLGVGPDVLVGVYAERSIEMVLGLYAILKAGGAYVPLDPEAPPERLASMLEDTSCPVVLAQQRQIHRLPTGDATVVNLDAILDELDTHLLETPGENQHLAQSLTPDHLAYVIFTSGSTGKPKGVMNTHRGICNRLLWMQDAFQLTPSDRVLQKTPFSFDVSVWEFFWPLMTGAHLVVAEPGKHRDSAHLVAMIQEHQITTLHFVPSMLQVFLDEPDVEKCTSLQRVICSGEALSYELQNRVFSLLDAELHNLYGPTEAAVDVTHWHCQRDSRQPLVPIGKPIANTQIYILDDQMQPVPIGIPGELHIGGVQVARGYLNRTTLTDAKFIPDPFHNGASNARLYKTGDLCRFLPDGNIEYLGRNDFQVKIRGVRIEPGEIEALLRQQPNIRDAVVILREDKPGDKRLVAYVIATAVDSIRVDDLRSRLREQLAEYMVPSAFVQLDAFPMTPNGKVNRKALPAPSGERQTDERFTAPRNDLESNISEIWKELLQVKQVGVHDNFFDLGGHSLLLAQIQCRLRGITQKQLPIVELFRYPTVAALADFLAADNDVQQDRTGPSNMIHDRGERQKAALQRRRQLASQRKRS